MFLFLLASMVNWCDVQIGLLWLFCVAILVYYNIKHLLSCTISFLGELQSVNNESYK